MNDQPSGVRSKSTFPTEIETDNQLSKNRGERGEECGMSNRRNRTRASVIPDLLASRRRELENCGFCLTRAPGVTRRTQDMEVANTRRPQGRGSNALKCGRATYHAYQRPKDIHHEHRMDGSERVAKCWVPRYCSLLSTSLFHLMPTYGTMVFRALDQRYIRLHRLASRPWACWCPTRRIARVLLVHRGE